MFVTDSVALAALEHEYGSEAAAAARRSFRRIEAAAATFARSGEVSRSSACHAGHVRCVGAVSCARGVADIEHPVSRVGQGLGP